MSIDMNLAQADGDFVSFYNNRIVKEIEDYVEQGSVKASYNFTPSIRNAKQNPFISFRCKSDGKYNALRLTFNFEPGHNLVKLKANVLQFQEENEVGTEIELYHGPLKNFDQLEMEDLINQALEELKLELI